MKDPSGGTTGRVQPYWRLGWMGARAGYSLGGFSAPTSVLSPAARCTFKMFADYFGRSRKRGALPLAYRFDAFSSREPAPTSLENALLLSGLKRRGPVASMSSQPPASLRQSARPLRHLGRAHRCMRALRRSGTTIRDSGGMFGGNAVTDAAYGAATARLTIFSRCSRAIRPLASSFDIGRSPSCSVNRPPLAPSMIVAL